MVYNGTTIPTGRDNTYNVDEIHRKSPEEIYNTAFNEDQKAIIEDAVSDIAELIASVQGLEEALNDLDDRVTALEEANNSGDDSGDDNGDDNGVA
ncbi:MAG: hypothetical protein J6Y02_15155 [Pseudobutyrivibrio sp.]|nr:hypothetical protein [Pseudobutyrivibrio sp.]